ncbi:hypothetical protein COLO4_03639 [Corchorus olitorius]|uniref:Uncharacterized protein n=1 Tax=Corchorus olitorius TaxID=93759 RepID=A0A1R3KXP4_9ROSI|nr:hypothetical protein COLO4_03639 [Corchorus olitorius]
MGSSSLLDSNSWKQSRKGVTQFKLRVFVRAKTSLLPDGTTWSSGNPSDIDKNLK